MRLSIALCTYNGEKFLQDQLESFAKQTRLPDEIVVCDDCSTDKTVEIIRSFAETAPFPVRLFVNDANLGYIKNFERAIKLCEGDIIFLSDQDDVWHTEKLEKFAVEFASDKEVGMVFCNGELVDENLHSLNLSAWQSRLFDKTKFKKMENGAGFPIVLWGNVISGCMMAFRAKYKDLLLPIPTNIREVIHDYWIALLLLTVAKVKPIPEKLVSYRQHNCQQVGLSLTNEMKEPFYQRAIKKHDFQAQIHKFEGLKTELNKRVVEHSENYQINWRDIFKELNDQLHHAQARLQITEGNLFPVSLMIEELISTRYHRYSNGWKSAAKDFGGLFK
jgi:glycosyltransferase involved in cell wall biosynthesis